MGIGYAGDHEINSRCRFYRLFIGEALARECDTLLAQDGSDTSLGDALTASYGIRGGAGFITGGNVGHVIGAQEPLRAGRWPTLAGSGMISRADSLMRRLAVGCTAITAGG